MTMATMANTGFDVDAVFLLFFGVVAVALMEMFVLFKFAFLHDDDDNDDVDNDDQESDVDDVHIDDELNQVPLEADDDGHDDDVSCWLSLLLHWQLTAARLVIISLLPLPFTAFRWPPSSGLLGRLTWSLLLLFTVTAAAAAAIVTVIAAASIAVDFIFSLLVHCTPSISSFSSSSLSSSSCSSLLLSPLSTASALCLQVADAVVVAVATISCCRLRLSSLARFAMKTMAL